MSLVLNNYFRNDKTVGSIPAWGNNVDFFLFLVFNIALGVCFFFHNGCWCTWSVLSVVLSLDWCEKVGWLQLGWQGSLSGDWKPFTIIVWNRLGSVRGPVYISNFSLFFQLHTWKLDKQVLTRSGPASFTNSHIYVFWHIDTLRHEPHIGTWTQTVFWSD